MNKLELENMDKFIETLKNDNSQQSIIEAKSALYRTGVTDENGNTKQQIVNR